MLDAASSMKHFPPFADIPTQCHVIINTEQDIDEALEAVAERIAAGKH
jgi:hypothetical protein